MIEFTWPRITKVATSVINLSKGKENFPVYADFHEVQHMLVLWFYKIFMLKLTASILYGFSF